MTLTAILPSLRKSLPDPLVVDRWPEHTVASTTDVFVSGVSMVGLAELCETPCVHNAAAVIPGTHGRPSPTAMASVIAVRVVSKSFGRIVVDGCVEHCQCVLTEARLVGRASTAHTLPVHVTGTGSESVTVTLPADVRVGDLLVFPCVGMTMLHDLVH